MATVKVYYFDAPARAEIIRLTLAAAGIEFEDVRFPYLVSDEWVTKYKPLAPFSQAPFVEYNGKRYGESTAIANFFARENGLYGANNMDAFRIDEVMGLAQDLFTIYYKILKEQDPAKKEELSAALVKGDVPKFFGFFQKFLQENGTGYLVNNKLSLADLIVYDQVTQLRSWFAYDVTADFPEIKALVEKVTSNKNVKKYIDSRK